jgi:hypothetical protein
VKSIPHCHHVFSRRHGSVHGLFDIPTSDGLNYHLEPRMAARLKEPRRAAVVYSVAALVAAVIVLAYLMAR